jgi:hypothetical protein
MRLGTPTAGLYVVAGSVTDVALVVAEAGAAEIVKNPHTDARPSPAVIRARLIPPPCPPYPRRAKYMERPIA